MTNPSPARREMRAEKRYLHLPVRNGAPRRTLCVRAGGDVVRVFEIELADGAPDWWAYLEIEKWRGADLVVECDAPEAADALAMLEQRNDIRDGEDLYREPLRPQLRFSARRGWINDPNGLVYHDGVYHLFYQHNPYILGWGSMHWGHAVSDDLVHWKEIGEALYPDDLGPMWSGSAVVDRGNTAGFGENALALLYTAAGNPMVQCLAYSADNGRTIEKYAGNPVVPNIGPGNRDPKVVRHEPSGRWVMALYVGLPDPERRNDNGEPEVVHTIHFLTSPDLKTWRITGRIDGYYECPDLFPLPLDTGETKWVLTAANHAYQIGSFDGEKFLPETEILSGHRGRGFYAAQTFSDIPAADGRRIQIGWLQASAPGMPFTQAMSLPLELTLRATDEGPRLSMLPVRELESLRSGALYTGASTLRPDDPNPLSGVDAELQELRADFAPGKGRVRFELRGIEIVYDGAREELHVGDHTCAAPLIDGRQSLIVYVDRTSVEAFASGGLVYVPKPEIADRANRGACVSVDAPVAFTRLDLFALHSIWQ